MDVKDHYDNHLSHFYSWMIGDYDSLVNEYLNYFKVQNFRLAQGQVAYDLGCGNGVQSLALARLGYSVHSFDFNRLLLDELKVHIGNYDITPIETDITVFDSHVNIKADLIVCMGDTITHLYNKSAIESLFTKCNHELIDGGYFVISFRDMSNELTGESRFISVKSDENRILTCFLEYFQDYIVVHDLIHEKENDKWIQKISSYQKVRISMCEMKFILNHTGFVIVSNDRIKGMDYIVAQKL